jgi:hypothetical protein
MMKALRDTMQLANHPFSEAALRGNVSAIDREWRRAAHDYLPRRHRETLTRSRKWNGKPVAAPVLLFENNSLRFLDGRHRFAAVRDAGCRWIPIATATHMTAAAKQGGFAT